MVHSPTTGSNLLDVVLCNEPVSIYNVANVAPFSRNDHYSVGIFCFYWRYSGGQSDVSGKTHSDCCDAMQQVFSYYWKNVDFDGMMQHLFTVDWFKIISDSLATDSLWAALCSEINGAIDMFVRLKTYKSHSNRCSTLKIHYPPGIKRAIARKRCLWRQCKRFPSNIVLKDAYSRATAKCRKLLRNFELRKEQQVVDNRNIGCFYNFFSSKFSCKLGIGALYNIQGTTVINLWVIKIEPLCSMNVSRL